jgi:hypothetical protein
MVSFISSFATPKISLHKIGIEVLKCQEREGADTINIKRNKIV